MTYDQWKTASPDDEYKSPPCEETPEFDDDDLCQWCGANSTQSCQWKRPQ